MDSRYREALDACRGFEDEDTRYFTRMSITRAAQQRHKVMNCHVGVDAVTTSDADSLPSVLFAGRGIATRGLVQARLRLLAEQQPDPTNRILLSGDNDALGVPKVHVQWKYNDGDLESVRRSLEVLGRQVALLNAGRLHFPDVDTLSSMGVTPGHYMGATRMSTDPRSGVVNPECRMHAVSNVYVAGGSVFPTGGAANPTLTIVALALRLAQQLRAATRDEP
jgi:choline dehydrogenase-like flavoprotein